MGRMIGEHVIVRGDKSGVFFGVLVGVKGSFIEMKDVRKLWYWEGAAAVEQIAKEGVKKPNKCNFTVEVEKMIITDAVQIIPCTEEAIAVIKEVPEWRID